MKPPQAAFKLVFLLLFLAVSATSLDISLEAQPPQSNPQFNPDRDAILGHLNEAITWYRDSSGKVEPVGLPRNPIYQDNARTLAAQAVKLAFESARAEAALVSSDQTPSANQKP